MEIERSINTLKTGNFSSVCDTFKNEISHYNTIKEIIETATTDLLGEWEGQGKDQFETDYHIVYRQLTDIGDILYELYDAIIEAEKTYIETDELLAKKITQ